MGGHFWGNAAAWTFTLSIFLLFSASAILADSNNTSLWQDLGLNQFPDVSKINISLDEYTHMMTLYLETRERSEDAANIVPKLITFNLENNQPSSTRLKFPIRRIYRQGIETESAQLRILASPQPFEPSMVRVRVQQIVGARRRRFLDERTIYLDKNNTKWFDFDVSSAVQHWLHNDRNLGLEIICLDCINKHSINPREAYVTALIYPPQHHRNRRSPSIYEEERRTDCRGGSGKKKCCRHNMTVKFHDFKSPDMDTILQPTWYEAGYCQGQCPPNFNYATNHSRIQGMVHQLERKRNKRAEQRTPKACCAPSKLGSLEILRINPRNTSKLMLETWENMKVIDCGCS